MVGEKPNQRSTWLIQEEPVRMKGMWRRRCLASHSLTAGSCALRDVANQVDVQFGGYGLIEAIMNLVF